MKLPNSPSLDPRRERDFEAELMARARMWVSQWGLSEDGQDFSYALLKVAAISSARVAERLDRCGDKMRRGFLDWLAIRGDAARPTRMPVVFNMVDKAPAAVDAPAPVRMQADAQGAAVVFETEKDVRVIPGRLEMVVATDADNDAIFLHMPGLTSIEPLDPLPTQWRLKSFAAAGSTRLQLDPDAGLVADMIVDVAGSQYRIEKADKDIVTIDPPLPAGAGIETGTIAKKVTAFEPFDPQARNRQKHAVYLGDLDLLNIEAEATVEVVGGQALRSGTQWAYWGKKDPDDTVGWQPLTLAEKQPDRDDAVRLVKPKGAVEPRPLGPVKNARWIAASMPNVPDIKPALSVDSLELRINCFPDPECPIVNAKPGAVLATDAMANTTPLVLNGPFYPLGRTPRQFDTFYLGCPEAFSKPGAHIQLCFELADATSFSLSAVHHAALAAPVLAGVGQDGALHLFAFDAAQATLARLFDGEPLQPPSPAYGSGPIAAPSIALDRKPRWRLPTWAEGQDFMVAATAGSHVWAWGENATDSKKSGWRDFGALPTDAPKGSPVEGLVYLEGTPSRLVALRGGKLYLRATAEGSTWSAVPTKAGNTVVVLKVISPILIIDRGRLVSSAAEGMVGVADDGKLYTVTIDGACISLARATELSMEVTPIALKDAGKLTVVAASQSRTSLVAVIHNGTGTSRSSKPLRGSILGFSLEAALDGTHLASLVTVRDGPNSYFVTWIPKGSFHKIVLPPAAGGAPTRIADHVLVPGENAEVFVRVRRGAVGVWSRQLGATDSNPELSWEYWSGSWSKLKIDVDETLNLKASGAIRFKIPPDIAATDWAGKTSFWIRARLIGGDYGSEDVSVVIEPLGGEKSKQTIVRSTAGIKPPVVVNLGISYSICDSVLPSFVLAEDSGSIRDQSDANRTLGAIVEGFIPLAVSLGRLRADGKPLTKPPGDPCPPDCECAGASGAAGASGTPSAVAAAILPPVVSPATGRALFLGFSAELSGAPVNVLFVIDREGDYAKLAPLTVEALVGDRFLPVVSRDGTRALGETGLLTLAFAQTPTRAELFGKPLAWLRLSPTAKDPSAAKGWKPSLKGTYLNAAWANATETLTRERVGSSDGSPNLTLKLARPPVLRDSLELRAKESLGTEERDALLKADRENVRNDPDLPGDWVRWKKVVDPGDEGPAERVFALDESAGEIRFGDGLHGAIPPVGPDSIVAFQYQRTEPPAKGAVDVPANAIEARTKLNLVTPVAGVEAVFSADHAAGGAPSEPDERVLQFGSAKLRHRGRAVTARDLEDLALASSPDIAQARALLRGKRIRLVIVMRGKEPSPNLAQCRELRRLLLGVAPFTARATDALSVEGPAVRRFRIELGLSVDSLDDAGSVAEEVRTRVKAFFDSATGGISKDGWPLGANPREIDVISVLIDVPHLESIADVALVEAFDDGTERPWAGSLEPNQLARLAGDWFRFRFEGTEVIA